MDEDKFPDEFYDWLNECPVTWFRDKYGSDSRTYTFTYEEEEEDEVD